MRPPTEVLALAALSAWACQTPPEPAEAEPVPAAVSVQLPQELRRCQPYAADPPVLAYCVAGEASSVWRTPVDVVCAHAGQYADLCRQNWAAAAAKHDRTRTLDELLPACGSDQDCAFEVLDTRLYLDPLAIAARCAADVPRHEEDCIGHAVGFWVAKTPDLSGLDQVLAHGERFPGKVGYHLGTLVGCRELGACPKQGQLGDWCRRRVKGVTAAPATCQQPGGPTLVGWKR